VLGARCGEALLSVTLRYQSRVAGVTAENGVAIASNESLGGGKGGGEAVVTKLLDREERTRSGWEKIPHPGSVPPRISACTSRTGRRVVLEPFKPLRNETKWKCIKPRTRIA
jgi:hypothetical protein